jgi:hypothetical protein
MSLDDTPGFSKPHYDVHSEIQERFWKDIPALHEIWNPAVIANMKFSPFSRDHGKKTFAYIFSFCNALEQGIYAVHCLKEFSSHESSNITEFYVSFYLNDFIARVKTGTDILALLVNQLYRLGFHDKECSLENGSIAGRLRSKSPTEKVAEKLANEIDRTRNNWLACFDILRDIAIHRSGFKFIAVVGADYPVHIQIPLPHSFPMNEDFPYNPGDPLAALSPYVAAEDSLLNFLLLIRSKSVSEYMISANPVIFCEEIWRLLSTSSENILSLLKNDLLATLNSA